MSHVLFINKSLIENSWGLYLRELRGTFQIAHQWTLNVTFFGFLWIFGCTQPSHFLLLFCLVDMLLSQCPAMVLGTVSGMDFVCSPCLVQVDWNISSVGFLQKVVSLAWNRILKARLVVAFFVVVKIIFKLKNSKKKHIHSQKEKITYNPQI